MSYEVRYILRCDAIADPVQQFQIGLVRGQSAEPGEPHMCLSKWSDEIDGKGIGLEGAKKAGWWIDPEDPQYALCPVHALEHRAPMLAAPPADNGGHPYPALEAAPDPEQLPEHGPVPEAEVAAMLHSYVPAHEGDDREERGFALNRLRFHRKGRHHGGT